MEQVCSALNLLSLEWQESQRGTTRRQHHRAAIGLHPHHLQSQGMPGQMMQSYPGTQLVITGMKDDAPVEDAADHVHDIFRIERGR